MEDFLYTEKEGEYIFKIIGKATMKNAKILSSFIDNIFDISKGISFEMSETIYMDSTFLGLLAKYAIDIKVSKSKNLIILNPSDEVISLLKQTGIIKFLDIISKDEVNTELSKVEGKNFDDNNEKSKYILQMHEILMDLNEENKVVFQPVVDAMRKVVK